ncbi:fumarylacetoacetate hydrolase family protein [Porticoccaceae bacterium LTM1]|nr:fumarylacetoacetate hydrolase family protein [Porticoccaceae bacterium LTM1]
MNSAELPAYQHVLDGKQVNLPVGKIVCIGRNYAEHARELNNPIPTEPLLFIKPATTVVPIAPTFSIPMDRGSCHFETELAILVGERLSNADESQAEKAILGVGVALDLTLRDVQQQLKEKGQPWEKAKAFDGACPLSEFVSFDGDLQNLEFSLIQNGEVRQQVNTSDMLTPVLKLMAYISGHFTLMPGDVVLTGTPAGVGPLAVGDSLCAELTGLVRAESTVR